MKNKSLSNLNILVVDDFDEIRAELIKHLKECGFTKISEATSAEEALIKLSTFKKINLSYDLIISDLIMPNMNGIDLLKAVRKDKLNRDVPFILISTESERSQIIEAISNGVNNYLIKPFDKTQILNKIKGVLPNL